MGCQKNARRTVLSGKKRTAAARLAKLTQRLEGGGDAGRPTRRRIDPQGEGATTSPPAARALNGWLAGAPEIPEDDVVTLTGDAGQGEASLGLCVCAGCWQGGAGQSDGSRACPGIQASDGEGLRCWRGWAGSSVLASRGRKALGVRPGPAECVCAPVAGGRSLHCRKRGLLPERLCSAWGLVCSSC